MHKSREAIDAQQAALISSEQEEIQLSLPCPFCGRKGIIRPWWSNKVAKPKDKRWYPTCSATDGCPGIVEESGEFDGTCCDCTSIEEARLLWEKRIGEKSGVCTWKMVDSDYNIWETDCGVSFVLEDGTPKENHLRYCCYCGRKLIEEK